MENQIISKRALYIKERDGKETFENKYGFAEYLHTPERNEIYLTDIFVLKEYRGQGHARRFYNIVAEIGREKGCKYMLGSYDKTTKNWQKTRNILENENFQKYGIDGDFIMMKKDL